MSSIEWRADSLRWRGRVLTGRHGHWCPDWDFLPIDETTPEWPCACELARRRAVRREWLIFAACLGIAGAAEALVVFVALRL